MSERKEQERNLQIIFSKKEEEKKKKGGNGGKEFDTAELELSVDTLLLERSSRGLDGFGSCLTAAKEGKEGK